jgi:predicted Zn-dependent protease
MLRPDNLFRTPALSSRALPGAHLPSSHLPTSPNPSAGKFLSQAECIALFQRVHAMAEGGGETSMALESTWAGNLRWARNQITTSGDARTNAVMLTRSVRGAGASVTLDMLDDTNLQHAVRRAEHLLRLNSEQPESDLHDDYFEPALAPHIFFDATYHMEADKRAAMMTQLVQPTIKAGMLAAGYIQVSAHGRTIQNSRGQVRYYPYTLAQYSVTVRDPKGTGSGWAGVDWNDWTRIDAEKISAVALDKCLRSRNPVAVEPGRYTTILEPQAVCDLFSLVMNFMDRVQAEYGTPPFNGPQFGTTKIGTQVFDDRITVTADPMDPDLGFPPFALNGAVYRPVQWFDNGVLTNLAYNRQYGVTKLGINTGLPNSGAFRMQGGDTTIDEMISTTKRGILVTRFSNIQVVDRKSLLYTGYTRDGLWLVENGKISKPIKNFKFTESPMFAFNSIDQIGPAVRVFHPAAPVIVPPVKVRDFSFTALADAI